MGLLTIDLTQIRMWLLQGEERILDARRDGDGLLVEIFTDTVDAVKAKDEKGWLAKSGQLFPVLSLSRTGPCPMS